MEKVKSKPTIKAKTTLGNAAAAAGPITLSGEYEKVTRELNVQVQDLKVAVEQVEREREFYFGKLREIEVFIQARMESGADEEMKKVFSEIQGIMYKVTCY